MCLVSCSFLFDIMYFGGFWSEVHTPNHSLREITVWKLKGFKCHLKLSSNQPHSNNFWPSLVWKLNQRASALRMKVSLCFANTFTLVKFSSTSYSYAWQWLHAGVFVSLESGRTFWSPWSSRQVCVDHQRRAARRLGSIRLRGAQQDRGSSEEHVPGHWVWVCLLSNHFIKVLHNHTAVSSYSCSLVCTRCPEQRSN